MKSRMVFNVAVAALVALVALAALSAEAFTRVRPLAELKGQNPEDVISRAPKSAQITLPARYYRGQQTKITDLQELNQGLVNGQIILQRQLNEMTAAYVAATNNLEVVTINRDQWEVAATNATARIERASAALDVRRAEYVAKRDTATLPTTKALYQAFIDALDSLKEKLGLETPQTEGCE